MFNEHGWIKEESVNDEADKDLLKSITDQLKGYQIDPLQYFSELSQTYAIYNKDNDNIGLANFSTENVVVIDPLVLKGILKYYSSIKDKKPESIKIFALDTAKKMIIYETSNDNYDLVYLENHDSPGRKKILPDEDDFNPTTSTTNP